MEIKQVKCNYVSAKNYRIENKLPDFEKIRDGLRPGIELKLIGKTEDFGGITELSLVGYFDHEAFIRRYDQSAFCGFLEKLQEITNNTLMIDTSGDDWEITIYDDYIE